MQSKLPATSFIVAEYTAKLRQIRSIVTAAILPARCEIHS